MFCEEPTRKMGSWNLSLSTTAWTLQGPQSLALISFRKLAWKMKRRMPEPGEGGGYFQRGKNVKVREKKGSQCCLSWGLNPWLRTWKGSAQRQKKKTTTLKLCEMNDLWIRSCCISTPADDVEMEQLCVLPSGCGCDLKPNSREKSGPSHSLWQARGKTGSSSTRRDSKYARMVSSATLHSLRDEDMGRKKTLDGEPDTSVWHNTQQASSEF